jgi:glycosyltransferase involved in cell wall biosynthesis
MKVAVDARLLRGGGIGRYIREITSRWLRDETVAGIRFLGHPDEIEAWLDPLPGREKAEVVPWRDPVYSLRAQVRWAIRGSRWTAGCEAVFFPHWDVPVTRDHLARVVTVHDLIHFLEPGGFPLWKRYPGRLLLRRAMRSAERVITVSEATSRDLERWEPDAEPRIRVIPNGVPHEVFRPLEGAERERAMERWGHLGPFLLFVGPLKPHKGAATALQALREVRRTHPDLVLVQAGPPEIRDPDVALALDDPVLQGALVQVGVLDDDALNGLYNLSACLVHPARREGFGLPPAEAMAAGTPVLASDSSSLPEVVGTGGRLVAPGDARVWSQALGEVLGDDRLREEMIRKGHQWVRRFSWDRSSARTLEVLKEAVAVRLPEHTGRGP